MNTPSIQEIRSNLSHYIQRVQQGETITISKRGHHVAVLISLDEYKRLTLPRIDLFDAITQFRQTHRLDEENSQNDEPSIDSIFKAIRETEVSRELDLD